MPVPLPTKVFESRSFLLRATAGIDARRCADLDLPLNELIVVTGVSGSGKSSLVFDTLYAEGQRRYVETFSPYARQFWTAWISRWSTASTESRPRSPSIKQTGANLALHVGT